jgi:hypothetical protein
MCGMVLFVLDLGCDTNFVLIIGIFTSNFIAPLFFIVFLLLVFIIFLASLVISSLILIFDHFILDNNKCLGIVLTLVKKIQTLWLKFIFDAQGKRIWV